MIEVLIYDYNSVFLDWQKAESTNGISHYRIYKDNIVCKNISGNYNQFIVNNLTEGVEYSFFVKGVTNNGTITKPTNTVKITLHTRINKLTNNLNNYI